MERHCAISPPAWIDSRRNENRRGGPGQAGPGPGHRIPLNTQERSGEEHDNYDGYDPERGLLPHGQRGGWRLLKVDGKRFGRWFLGRGFLRLDEELFLSLLDRELLLGHAPPL